MKRREFVKLTTAGLAGFSAGLAPHVARAADLVKVGVFPSSSALPYYVALRRGYFKEAGIETETVVLNTHPLIVQSFVTGAIDAATNLVTLEGANINARRPETLAYISLGGQNAKYIVEQFVVKAGSAATKLTDLKGTKLFSAPGPANIGAARAVLKAVGLEEGKDFTIQEQQLGTHVGALQSGNFDGGYTLEPLASVLIKNGVGKRLEAGVIATHLMGNAEAEAYAAGCALSGPLLKTKPDLAKRFADAWNKAVSDANTDVSARDLLAAHMNVPADLAPSVPLAHFVPTRTLTAAQLADFQKFIDIGSQLGVVSGKIDAKTIVSTI